MKKHLIAYLLITTFSLSFLSATQKYYYNFDIEEFTKEKEPLLVALYQPDTQAQYNSQLQSKISSESLFKSLQILHMPTINSGTLAFPFTVEEVVDEEEPHFLIINSLMEDEIYKTEGKEYNLALEGGIRRSIDQEKTTQILFLYSINIHFIESYLNGEIPTLAHLSDEIVSAYPISYINLSKIVADKIQQGEYKLADFATSDSKAAIEITHDAIANYFSKVTNDPNPLSLESDRLEEPPKIFTGAIDNADVHDADQMRSHWEINRDSLTPEENQNALRYFNGKAPDKCFRATSKSAGFTGFVHGNTIAYWVKVGPNEGIIETQIDGQYTKQISLYSPIEEDKVIYIATDLTNARHYIQVRPIYSTRSKSYQFTVYGILSN